MLGYPLTCNSSNKTAVRFQDKTMRLSGFWFTFDRSVAQSLLLLSDILQLLSL